MDLKTTPQQLVLVLAGWAFALTAAAQWQWIDKDGRKVFSDRPPTSEIRDKDILRQPGSRGRSSAAGTAEAPPATGASAAAAPVAKAGVPKLSGKDAGLEARKKKLEEEEAAKHKAEEEKVAKGRADNCERAKKGLATFQSGVRMSTINAQGEREFLDDAARAAEGERLQSIVDSDCK